MMARQRFSQPSRKLQLLNMNDVSRCLSRYSLPLHFHVRSLHCKKSSSTYSSDEEKHKKVKETDFRLQKSKGQHLLVNPSVLYNILRAADVRPTDTVPEIGPGTGNLTLKLLEACRRVVAVEIDPRMVDVLLQTVFSGG